MWLVSLRSLMLYCLEKFVFFWFSHFVETKGIWKADSCEHKTTNSLFQISSVDEEKVYFSRADAPGMATKNKKKTQLTCRARRQKKKRNAPKTNPD